MATMMMAAASNAALLSTSLKEPASPSNKKTPRRSVAKLASFTGMKAESRVSRLGLAASTEEGFAALGARVRSSTDGRKGGAMSSSCSVASEISRIVPIMSGLVLVGIALGFVLIRVEAAVEEAEAEAE